MVYSKRKVRNRMQGANITKEQLRAEANELARETDLASRAFEKFEK